MLAIALALVLGPDGSPPGTCRLAGKLTLTENQTPISPQGLAYVFVEHVPAREWRPPNATHTVVQKDRQFSKSVLVVVQDDTVEFTNEDLITHSVFSASDIAFRLQPSSKPKTGFFVVAHAGTYHMRCDIHARERLDILAVKNPFYAAVSSDGTYAIENLPFGGYTVVAWEPNGYQVSARKVECRAAAGQAPELTLERGPPEHHHIDSHRFFDPQFNEY
jgi:plastocyanin